MIPSDPVMLLSFLNMKLRDYYGSLPELCEDLEVDQNEIELRMEGIGYQYNASQNKFVWTA